MIEFVLVLSLWGLTGEGQWVYTGNQIVLNEPLPQEQCIKLMHNWTCHQSNEYYSFSLDCVKVEQDADQ